MESQREYAHKDISSANQHPTPSFALYTASMSYAIVAWGLVGLSLNWAVIWVGSGLPRFLGAKPRRFIAGYVRPDSVGSTPPTSPSENAGRPATSHLGFRPSPARH
ncbi:hypothetical protein F4679DRAFT_585447 [Xylaria curta]|nr:hypothetical protein F4679DRAFT_585447 [Xylaria curta]